MSPAARHTPIDLSGLNEAQREIATCLDEPLFVAAGAGSGKTYTLTQRVLWALTAPGKDGAPYLEHLSELLVITFTEAAAREIRERLRSELYRTDLRDAALEVDDAWISTIHAMCSRILKRHALELGLDPAFTVLDDAQSKTLLYRALDDTIGYARSHGEYAPLLEEFGAGGPPQGFSRGATGLMGVLECIRDTAKKSPLGMASLKFCVSTSLADDAIRDIRECYADISGRDNLTPKAFDAAMRSLALLDSYFALPAEARTDSARKELLAALVYPTASKAIPKEELQALKLLALLVRFADVQSFVPLAVSLVEVLERSYAARKREISALDYDDLVIQTLEALKNKTVQKDYVGRFKLVMVDEFQDTDEIQLQVISALSAPGQQNLCTVGDAQQSIYRFRGADVEVFRSRGRIPGIKKLQLTQNYRSHQDILAFVSRIFSVSGKSGDRVGEGDAGGAGGGASAAPGVAAPTTPEAAPTTPDIASALLEDFMVLSPAPSRRDNYRATELPRIDLEIAQGTNGETNAAALSERLAEGMADAFARFRDAGEDPGNMVLLLGTTTHADSYVDAIRARGISCVVTRGSGFAKTREVAAVLALLYTLADPADTSPGLFSLLSSEVFSLDADDFCNLGTRRAAHGDFPAKRPIDEGFKDWDFFAGYMPSERLEHAHRVLCKAKDALATRSLHRVVLDVVYESGWLSRLSEEGPEGLARAANVLKAVEYIEDLTLRLGLGPQRCATEFKNWLENSKLPPASLAAAAAGVGASKTSRAGGTLQVMTVHGAKGLEFNICGVSEVFSNDKKEAHPVEVSPADDAGYKTLILRPKDTGTLPDLIDTLCVKDSLVYRCRLWQDLEDNADKREATRLLYVALTRAKEALILGIPALRRKKDAAIMSLLASRVLGSLGLLGSLNEKTPDTTLRLPSGCNVAVHVLAAQKDANNTVHQSLQEPMAEAFSIYELPELDSTLAPEHLTELRRGVVSYSSLHEAALLSSAAKASVGSPASDNTAAPRQSGRLSASALAAAGDEDSSAVPPDDADKATNLGSAFHEIAAALVECPGRSVEELISARCPALSPGTVGLGASGPRAFGLTLRQQERLVNAVHRWAGSALRRRVCTYEKIMAEVPFFCPAPEGCGDYLEGYIDLLAYNPGSTAVLLIDYKTGDLKDSYDEIAQKHHMQAEIYAQVLLQAGFSQVECVFVIVEREDPEAPGEPLSVCYRYTA